MSEPDTLKDILLGLKKEDGLFSSERTIVMDAGIATEDNIALIRKNGYKHVLVKTGICGRLAQENISRRFLVRSGRGEDYFVRRENNVEHEIIRTEEEAFLLCHSEAKEAKEKAILSLKEQRFEQELASIKEGLEKTKRQKKYDKILERIGRLKERYKVGNLYTIKVEQSDGKATDLQFGKNDQAQAKEDAIGTYVLRTNRLDLSGEEISKLHRSLTTVEESFETMKGALGLRPNFHHRDIPTIAHVHVTVLAYHMLAEILKKLRTSGIYYDWNTIRNCYDLIKFDKFPINHYDNTLILLA